MTCYAGFPVLLLLILRDWGEHWVRLNFNSPFFFYSSAKQSRIIKTWLYSNTWLKKIFLPEKKIPVMCFISFSVGDCEPKSTHSLPHSWTSRKTRARIVAHIHCLVGLAVCSHGEYARGVRADKFLAGKSHQLSIVSGTNADHQSKSTVKTNSL